MWEIVKKSLDKNEVENLTNFVEDRLFKVFLKLLGYKLCIWKEIYTCEFYVILTPYHVWFSSNHLIWFPLSLWQRNQIQVSAFFTLDDAFFPAAHGGKEVPWLCVGKALAYEAKRPHTREVLFDALSLLLIGGEKNIEGLDEATVHGAKSLHTREDNIMSIVNGWILWPIYVVMWYICDNLPYVK